MDCPRKKKRFVVERWPLVPEVRLYSLLITVHAHRSQETVYEVRWVTRTFVLRSRCTEPICTKLNSGRDQNLRIQYPLELHIIIRHTCISMSSLGIQLRISVRFYTSWHRKRCRNFNLVSIELGDIPEDKKDKLTDDDTKGKFESAMALLFVWKWIWSVSLAIL